MIGAAPALNKYHGYSIGVIVFVVSLVAFTFVDADSVFSNCDTPWHIAVGDHLRAVGEVPRTDPWSFTAGDHRWHNLSWLYDVIISLLNSVFGLRGLLAINLLMATLVPLIVVRLCLIRNSSVLATLLASLVGIVMYHASVSIRPHQVSIIFASLSLLVLYRHRIAPTRWLWALPVIALLWANFHGSYLVLFTFIGSFFLESFFAKDWRRVRALFAVGIVSLIATMIMPLGPNIFHILWIMVSSGYGKSFIMEWQSASLSTQPQLFLLLAVVLLLAFKARLKLPFADSLLLTFWMIMAFDSIRHLNILSVVVTPIIAMMLTKIFSDNQGFMAKLDAITVQDFGGRKLGRQFLGLGAIVLGVYLILITRNVILPENLNDPNQYPVTEVNYLDDNFAGSHIFNDYCYGGNIIYQTRGRVKPILDSRIETVYPTAVIDDYAEMLDFRQGWTGVAEKYDFDFALFPNENDRAKEALILQGWNVEFEGPVATIYKNPKRKKGTSP